MCRGEGMRNMHLKEFEKLQEQLDKMTDEKHPDLDELQKISAELDKHIDRIMEKE